MIRAISDIAAGLEPPRKGAPLRLGVRLHVIGVGGTASLAAALHAKALGLSVSGYDQALTNATREILTEAGVRIGSATDADVISHCGSLNSNSLVAISKAITSTNPDHPELAAARTAGAHLISVQQIIADAAATRGGLLIGIGGTHGKTTTTGWVLDALIRSGLNPSAFVGGPLVMGIGTPPGSPVHIGSEPGFIVEADEYGGNFDPYYADRALILNVDWDHPDIFSDRRAAVETFARWATTPASGGVLFINTSDTGGAELATLMAKESHHGLYTIRIPTSRESTNADVVGRVISRGEGSYSLELTHLTDRAAAAAPALLQLRSEQIPLALLGSHNASNALGVAALAASAGGTAEGISQSLAQFTGVGRRLEVRYDASGITVLDDYGHHPTAIDVTLATVRDRYPGRRLVLAIEPLTYHRTAALLDSLARSCSAADEVAVAEIFAVRDLDTTSVTSEDLARRIAALGTPATAPGTVLETAAALLPTIAPNSVVLVMGGGRSTELAAALADGLAARGALRG